MRRWHAITPFASTSSPPASSAPPLPATNATSPSANDTASPRELTGAERLDQIGSALQDLGNGFAGLEHRPQDAAALDAMQRQLQQQQDAFAQRIGFQRMPGPYQYVAPVTLNAPTGAARPGDLAIRAMADLHR